MKNYQTENGSKQINIFNKHFFHLSFKGNSEKQISGASTYDDFSGQFFRIFEIINFCFFVAIFDLVHDVETIFHLSYVLTAFGNLF